MNEGDGFLGKISTLYVTFFRIVTFGLKQQFQQPCISAHRDGKMTDVFISKTFCFERTISIHPQRLRLVLSSRSFTSILPETPESLSCCPLEPSCMRSGPCIQQAEYSSWI